MNKKIKKLIAFSFSLVFVFLIGNFALAQIDTGLNEVSVIGLGDADPRVVAANVIRIFLGFLGIIALVLILYAGFLWTTSAGDPSKIDKAKKILVSAIIGLLIILSSFAIASFILSRLLSATTSTSGTTSTPCVGAGCLPPPPDCVGAGCSPSGTPCDGNTLTPICDPTDSMCVTGVEYCEASSCTCQLLGGPGADCDFDTTGPACVSPDDSMCMAGLVCDPTGCTCEGAPIIDWISPVDYLGTPNGAEGDIITIGGRFFGATAGTIVFGGQDVNGDGDIFGDADDRNGISPSTVNANCTDTWTETQVIIVVPSGVSDGPIKIIRQADSAEDVTDNSRGAPIDDFLVNIEKRPGVCGISPITGSFEDPFTLQGVSFLGPPGATQEVNFGNPSSFISAVNINSWTNSSVVAGVPNVGGGNNTVYVSVNGSSSNAVGFNVFIDNTNVPFIEDISPEPGPPGQYITITGSGFGNSYAAPAEVLFTAGPGTTNPGSVYTADGLSFPLECQDSWWSKNIILVQVPILIGGDGNLGDYTVTVTNSSNFTSQPYDYFVNTDSPGPGICKMSPRNGPTGLDVDIFGDNFTNTTNTVNFHNAISATTFDTWENQFIETYVPVGAQTGPVEVFTSTSSNPVLFTVGYCDASIATTSPNFPCDVVLEECCPSSTYWSGICRDIGSCDDGAPISDTGYGWSFTSEGTTTETPTDPTETCSGWSGGNACLADNVDCPNSPGECQTNPNPITGFCGDNYCESLAGCGPGNCEYDDDTNNPTYNKCIATPGGAVQDTCSEPSTSVYAGYTATCATVTHPVDGTVNAWQITVPGSCPAGTYQDATNGKCTVGSLFVPLAQTCDICDSGFTCEGGACAKAGDVCNGDSACDGSFCLGSATCECCCEVGANDCCMGLTCSPGGCGDTASSTVQANFGQCTGCRVENAGVVDQAASDLACNCSGTTGKICQINPALPSDTGTCVDAPPPSPPTDVGDPCVDGASCTVGTTACSTGQFCDPGSCTCQLEKTYPGALCIQELFVGLTSNFVCDPSFNCGAGYDCLSADPPTGDPLDSCGTCCCDPTIPQTLPTADGGTLTCQEDKGPCSGEGRGLYCGCESDTECGNTDLNACGDDTCCQPRPYVVSTIPPDEPSPVTDSDKACRNVMIEATFNKEMNVSTFSGNVIVLGDYGNDPCPVGTQYLSQEEREILGEENTFTQVSNVLKGKINKFFIDEAKAFFPIGGTNNYCAVTGKTSGYNDVSGQGVLTFSPNKPLDGDIRYYVIILGDRDLGDDSSQGVLDEVSLSMGTTGTTPLATFNAKEYENAYIWSFVTLPDQGPNQGYCLVDYINVVPASYLIQTTENSLVEDDTNPLANSFDTVNDSDKRYTAKAKTISGQTLVPVPGVYSWTWGWSSSNIGIADFVSPSVFASDGDNRLIRAQSTATDGHTVIQATANITGTIGSDTKVGDADLYLFLCNNPWPPFDASGQWAPWSDQENNCTIYPEGAGATNSCINANYEFYYCRDQGTEDTYDDLPPILNESVIRGRDADQDLFKEYYFFREETPDLSSITVNATAPTQGGTINVSWSAFTVDPGETVQEFLVHYGTASGNYSDSVSVGPAVFNTSLTGLSNGTIYYIAVTAVYVSGAESDPSPEISATPVDTLAPFAPSISTTTVGNAQIEIEWTEITDASSYRIYWKAGSGCVGSTPPDCYASSQNVGNSTGVVITDLANGTPYFFAVTAIDSSGNESPYSGEVSDTPVLTAADINTENNLVLAWDSSDVPAEESLYYLDDGEIAGAFEALEEMEGNRVNLFGSIMKFLFKKISHTFVSSAEAQSREIEILLCDSSDDNICREEIITVGGEHRTIVKNLNEDSRYKLILKKPSSNIDIDLIGGISYLKLK
ncbi:hypothetical protein C0584_05515 [Candidatus Parcubacteria bacterium]|nr:MAG: hypothetical protein C0584_05515 [Candidatus Parcubacteria bacterium]